MNQEKITETIITSLIKELISSSKSIVKGIEQETKHLFNIGLNTYLSKQNDKYSTIKTLLRGNTPIYIYDIYFPLKLTKNEKNKKTKIISTDSFHQLTKKDKYFTIIGDAGSGKSTLVKHLFLSSIKEKKGIPILIELRYLNNSDSSFEDYIITKIFENEISENWKIMERILNNGKFVFFLDGYDELNATKKNDVISSLNRFIEKYPKNKFFLTTRPYSNIEHLPLFSNYNMKPLEFKNGEVFGFIDKQLSIERELSEKIKISIKENKNKYVQSFLTNPLLLSLYILTFQSNSSIPSKKYVFYRRVINALFSEHDSKTKLGFVREKMSKLNQEQFEEILKAFCFLSYFENQFNFDRDYVESKLRVIKVKKNELEFNNSHFIYDLKSAIALWTDDYGIYAFAHRSLQEYFAALFVKHLNDLDKQRAYDKIIDKFSKKTALNEVENFLSLCEEMDLISFYQFYAIPLYEEMLSLLDFSNKESTLHSIIKFMTGDKLTLHGLRFVDADNSNPILYKTLYLSLPYMQKLHDLLMTNVIRGFEQKARRKKIEEIPIIDIGKFLPKEIRKELDEEKFLELATSFKKHLITSLNKAKKYIEDSKTTDKDLVDLI